MDCDHGSITVCRIKSRSSANESWAHSNASSPAAGADSTSTGNIAGQGRKSITASRTSDRMKSISVLSSAGATIGPSPKVIRVDPGEVWRIPRTMGPGAAWGGDHGRKNAVLSRKTASADQAAIFDV